MAEYKSPIEYVKSKISREIEEEVMKAVQNVGIQVDKDELFKALNYDRDQYKRGYEEGMEVGFNQGVNYTLRLVEKAVRQLLEKRSDDNG